MDFNIPEWALDVERQRQNMMFGRIPLEIVVSQNKVAKVIGTKNVQTKFRNNDEAMIYILDWLRTTALQQDGTVTFSIITKGGKISQINQFEQVEVNYPV